MDVSVVRALLNCKNEYLVLAPEEESTVQAVVGSIVWAFRRLKKPRIREMNRNVDREYRARNRQRKNVEPKNSRNHLDVTKLTAFLQVRHQPKC